MINNRKSSIDALLHSLSRGTRAVNREQNAADRKRQKQEPRGHGSTPSERQEKAGDDTLPLDDLIRQLVLAQATDLARAGRYTEAERLLKENTHDQEMMPAMLDLQARICAQQGRYREAHVFWTRALQLDPINEAYVAGLLRLKGYSSSRWPWSMRHGSSTIQQRTTHAPSSSSSDGLLLAHPEGGKWRYELMKGHLVRNPIAGGGHDCLVYRLTIVLGAFVEAHTLGVITLSQAGYEVALPDEQNTVWVPDLAFVQAARVPAEDSPAWTRPWNIAPDLVVEVVAPGHGHQEVDQRAYGWLERGVRLVWIIWPLSKTVDVWLPTSDRPVTTLGVGETLDGLDVVPGFTCPLAHLFRSTGKSFLPATPA